MHTCVNLGMCAVSECMRVNVCVCVCVVWCGVYVHGRVCVCCECMHESECVCVCGVVCVCMCTCVCTGKLAHLSWREEVAPAPRPALRLCHPRPTCRLTGLSLLLSPAWVSASSFLERAG